MYNGMVTEYEYRGDYQMQLFDASLLRHANVLELSSIAFPNVAFLVIHFKNVHRGLSIL